MTMPRRSCKPACLLVGVLLLPSAGGAAWAGGEPLWELGLGVAPVSFPAYRGSRSQANYVLPIPYAVYSGKRLRVDREGARGMLFASPRFAIDISVDGAVPVDSDDDGPRAGMDDLDPVFEAGPSFNWYLTDDGRWRVRIPVRAAIAIDSTSTRSAGWKLHPMLRYSTPDPGHDWNIGFSIGPIFATRHFHAYYYDVDDDDATADRPAYTSSGGYSGSAVAASASRRFGRTWFGMFMRYDYLGGAQFEDSPLVETRHATTVGFGISRVIWQSSQRVPLRRTEGPR